VKQLSDDLGGDVLDETKKQLSQAKVNQWRQQIRQFEESRYTGDLFAE